MMALRGWAGRWEGRLETFWVVLERYDPDLFFSASGFATHTEYFRNQQGAGDAVGGITSGLGEGVSKLGKGDPVGGLTSTASGLQRGVGGLLGGVLGGTRKEDQE